MYKLSAPLLDETVTRESREKYLAWLQAGGTDRLFIAVTARFSDEMTEEAYERLKENIRYFNEHGVETFVWQGQTIGHGVALSHERADGVGSRFAPLVNAEGDALGEAYCPLDEAFVDALCEWIKKLAKTGAKTILFDDDLRMGERLGDLSSNACCCKKHLARISELCGEKVDLQTVKDRVLSGKPNKYRDAWLQAQSEGLVRLAKRLRGCVDEVDPSVRLALCSCWSHWDVDGADALKLTKILAGKHKPLLRLHGAPYWEKMGMYHATLISAVELERMLASFCKGEDVEIFAEGDVYPRPRYHVPAAHLEIFDGALRAWGGLDGIMKYTFDYVADESYEQGYIKAHIKNLPTAEKLSETFDGRAEGVRIYAYPHLFGESDIPRGEWGALGNSPAAAGAVLAENGIPTVYEGEGLCACVFGDNARKAPTSALEKGGIIDGVAAEILQKRGVDVGFVCVSERRKVSFPHEYYGGKAVTVNAECSLFFVDIDPAAKVLSTAKIDGKEYPTSYFYENAQGQKFLVLCYAALHAYGGLRVNYARQQTLKESVERISGRRLPAFCGKNPHLYCVTKRNGGKLQAAFFNCFEDEILAPVILLDKAYSRIRFVSGSGRLDGDRVLLDGEIPAYKFIAFEAE